MLEALIDWDYRAFELLYYCEGTPWEPIMQALSAKAIWIPLYLLIVQQVVLKYGRQSWLPLIMIIAVVVIADQLTSGWMKPHFARLRPCHDPLLTSLDFTRRCGGQFGFASSHAANTMGLAVAIHFLFKNRWAVLLSFWAMAVAYSRVFLGVHFPLDVLAGMGTGALLAMAAWLTMRPLLQSQFTSLK